MSQSVSRYDEKKNYTPTEVKILDIHVHVFG